MGALARRDSCKSSKSEAPLLYEGLLDSAGDSWVAPSEPRHDDLLRQFDVHFETVSADAPHLVPLAQRVRYQVYCVENRFESPADHSGQLERDEFDSHAVHSLLIDRNTRDAIGTVRLVLPLSDAPHDSFAIQRLSDHPLLKGSRRLPLHATGEVSRLSLSREFGRRAAATKALNAGRTKPTAAESALYRCGPLMRLGLMQMLVRMSMQNGITHLLAVMEPKLLRMLAAMAIHFEPLGGLVEYHGLRQPCFCNLGDVLQCVKRERPAFWNVLTDGGTL
jgi:N-acyl amino acid synthase of PEP-CTERM/exosortase system